MTTRREVLQALLPPVGVAIGTVCAFLALTPAAPPTLHCGCEAVSCARPCVPGGTGCCPDAKPEGCPVSASSLDPKPDNCCGELVQTPKK